MRKEALHVLMVEDNLMDIILTTEILSESKTKCYRVTSMNDGLAALNFLKSEKREDMPDVVLLDLNLPKMSGFEVLAELRKKECLSNLPVFILTTSSQEDDIKKAKQMNALHFFTKPFELEKFEAILADLDAGATDCVDGKDQSEEGGASPLGFCAA